MIQKHGLPNKIFLSLLKRCKIFLTNQNVLKNGLKKTNILKMLKNQKVPNDSIAQKALL